MSENRTRFQQMNGCSACKHAKDSDPAGKPASMLGKGFWCASLGKAVDARDGAECDAWELSS
jgi:hypothetical protein